MKKPHKHAELIKQWADGAEIQWYDDTPKEHRWKDCPEWFIWNERYDFRIKPTPKPDVILYRVIDLSYPPTNEAPNGFCRVGCFPERMSNIKLTFDGETKQLKSAEVL